MSLGSRNPKVAGQSVPDLEAPEAICHRWLYFSQLRAIGGVRF
jgi:hypothetical protein